MSASSRRISPIWRSSLSLSSADFSSLSTAETISLCNASLRLSEADTRVSSSRLRVKILSRSASSSDFARLICASCSSRSRMIFSRSPAFLMFSSAFFESCWTFSESAACRCCSASRAVLSVSSICVCTNVSLCSAASASFFWAFVLSGLSKFAMLSKLSSKKSHMTIKSDLLIQKILLLKTAPRDTPQQRHFFTFSDKV